MRDIDRLVSASIGFRHVKLAEKFYKNKHYADAINHAKIAVKYKYFNLLKMNNMNCTTDFFVFRQKNWFRNQYSLERILVVQHISRLKSRNMF